MTRETIPALRLGAILAALSAGMVGYGLAEAVAGAKEGEALVTVPSLARFASYGIVLAALAGLALAVELGGPPAAARGGRAARRLRALVRRLCRGRRRAEIARVEAGLTISACLILTAAAVAFASAKSVLVILTAGAILATVQAARALCRLVGFNPGYSGLAGFLSGLAAGYLLA